MKHKKLIVFTLFLALTVSLFAEDDGRKSEKRIFLNWGMGFGANPDLTTRTSVLGFGFIIFKNDKIDIRNQIEFCNGVMVMEDVNTKYYRKVFSDKLSIGWMTRDGLFRPYGFLEGRVGTNGSELYDMFDNPLLWNLGLGTGVDIFVTKSISFYLQFGFLGNFFQEEFIPQQRYELGTQIHF